MASPLRAATAASLALLVVMLTAAHLVEAAPLGNRKNMVLFYLDDARIDLKAAYGRKYAQTPELDRFAKSQGTVVIGRAYSNYPMCSPSRMSTLFGKLPTKTAIMTNLDEDDDHASEVGYPSLAKFLQSRGYFTATGGKVFHQPGINGDDCWNMTFTPTIAQQSKWCRNDRKSKHILIPGTKTRASPQLCLTKNALKVLPDSQVADGAVRALDHIVAKNLFPFFMSVGFYKPHVPIHVHERFWKMVPSKIVPDAERPSPPGPQSSFPYPDLSFIDDANNIYAVKKAIADLTVYAKRPVSKKYRQLIRRAYSVGITQSDFFFGKVYRAIEAHNLLQDTLIVFISDHGYQLGENNQWAKNVLFDNALRVPMIFSAPWLSKSKFDGVLRLTSTFFELVDIYKTALGLLELDEPEDLDGDDQSDVIRQTIGNNEDPYKDTPGKGNAISVVARCAQFDSCVRGQTDVTAIGYTYRDYSYRYVVWMRTSSERQVNWGDPESFIADELYDHSNDDATICNFENLSYDTEYQNIIADHPEIRQKYFELTRKAFAS